MASIHWEPDKEAMFLVLTMVLFKLSWRKGFHAMKSMFPLGSQLLLLCSYGVWCMVGNPPPITSYHLLNLFKLKKNQES